MEVNGYTFTLGTDRYTAQALFTGSGTFSLIDFQQEWRVDEVTPSAFRRSDQFAVSVQEAPAGTMKINLSVPNNWNTNIINVTSTGFGSFDGSGTVEGLPFDVWDDPFDRKIWRIIGATISRGDIYEVTPTRYGYDVSFRVNLKYYDSDGNPRYRLQGLDFTVYSFNVTVTGPGIVVFDSPSVPQTIRPIGGGGTMFLASALLDGVGEIAPERTFEDWRIAVERSSPFYEVPTYCT